MSAKLDHRYASGSSNDHLTCACGHQELIDDDLATALERMNTHIRASFTDEEWGKRMQNASLAMLDPDTGAVKMPPGGAKS